MAKPAECIPKTHNVITSLLPVPQLRVHTFIPIILVFISFVFNATAATCDRPISPLQSTLSPSYHHPHDEKKGKKVSHCYINIVHSTITDLKNLKGPNSPLGSTLKADKIQFLQTIISIFNFEPTAIFYEIRSK